MLKMKQKNENGMTLISLVITVIVLILVSFSVSTNLKNNADLQKLVYLRNDIENLEGKVEEFFDEYGELPASIEYTDISNLKDVFSSAELSSDFYVIDLQTMQGLSLHYGKDYDKIKNVDPDRTTETVNEYKDVYIINKTTHNIFYVQGISIKENGKTIIYYTSKGNSKDFNGTNVANPPEMLSGMKKIMYKNPTNTKRRNN